MIYQAVIKNSHGPSVFRGYSTLETFRIQLNQLQHACSVMPIPGTNSNWVAIIENMLTTSILSQRCVLSYFLPEQPPQVQHTYIILVLLTTICYLFFGSLKQKNWSYDKFKNNIDFTNVIFKKLSLTLDVLNQLSPFTT